MRRCPEFQSLLLYKPVSVNALHTQLKAHLDNLLVQGDYYSVPSSSHYDKADCGALDDQQRADGW